jgi:hypothetical protein
LNDIQPSPFSYNSPFNGPTTTIPSLLPHALSGTGELGQSQNLLTQIKNGIN